VLIIHLIVLFFAITLIIVSIKVGSDEVKRVNEEQSKVEDFENYQEIHFDDSVIDQITALLMIAIAMILFSIILFYFALFARSEEFDKLNERIDRSDSMMTNLDSQIKTITSTTSNNHFELNNLKNSIQMEFDITMNKMGKKTHRCPYCQGRASLINEKDLIYQCISCRSRYEQFGENYIKIE
jgi:DNA-directed RNA polymerase subunit RPC12/RpoP